jgi:phage terminase large subunit
LHPQSQTPRPRPQHLREYAASYRRVQELRRGTDPSDEADQLTGPAEAYAEILGEPFDSASIDFLNPDYSAILTRRADARARLQERIELLPALKRYYADRPAQFITDWGLTYDPRNADIGLPTTVPFILFPRQVEWIEFILDNWHNRRRGITEKSREVGVSWLAIGLSCTLCLFHVGLTIGFASRLNEYVDQVGDPKTLLWKARAFLDHLPPEFLGGWDQARHAPYMRIFFPENGSVIFGEGGDDIGRGARAAIYFVDEAARLRHPDLAEASLSQTTNCRQDLSTPNGLANPFYINRASGRFPVFTFHWRSDPRKNEAWYEKQKAENSDVVVAQEIDIDYGEAVHQALAGRKALV